MISFIAHPDYLINRRARGVYETLIAYLRQFCDRNGIWVTVPGEVDRWWRARSGMQLVEDSEGWRIEGPGSERARVAYATIDNDRIFYNVGTTSVSSS